ncbi:MAG: hypothetical protein HY459_01150 [Parcubacteria group bacterium]|nr:hypothetical protein [Parcubacteria group bacterium]
MPTPIDQINFLESFPYAVYPQIRPSERRALEILNRERSSVLLELPVGSGKTAIGYTFLRALEDAGHRPLFYITPTKTLVDQVKRLHPEVRVVYGRSEYPCFYYPDEDLKADEIPCSLLKDCPHRVDQETGQTFGQSTTPCPYLLEKYRAKQGGIVVSTTAFYLFTQLFSKEWGTPAGLVVDEAHRIANTIRSCLSYEITDYHLGRSVELLEEIDAPEAKILKRFLRQMTRIARRKPARAATLLDNDEIQSLLDILLEVDTEAFLDRVTEAVRERVIDPREERETLKQLEVLIHDLVRYITSLEYSRKTREHFPLNYTYAFYKEEKEGRERVQYRLVIRAYYVAPIVRRLLSPFTVAYSATIGDPQVFGFENGIHAPFFSLPSDFPVENTRIFLPTDTPNLARDTRRRQDLARTLRRVARACVTFAADGKRSLVVVVSEEERNRFLRLAEEEGLTAMSYGNGVLAKEAARRFKDGEGDTLVGTAANYGEGIDLPHQLAPIIFFLRPGYPIPTDPGTVFEERRFGGMRWKLWTWRVMIEGLQVRGRNVRSATDLGVTFFISQQFRRFVFASLPEWLQSAYHGEWTFEHCVEEAQKILRR